MKQYGRLTAVRGSAGLERMAKQPATLKDTRVEALYQRVVDSDLSVFILHLPNCR